jgi:large subunit ribosomal protein L17
MRHQKAGRKFNRTASHRDAMLRNMVTSLFAFGRIKTTDAKAKELRRWADRMITLAKRGDLHARRQALSVVRDKSVVATLFENVTQRFGARAGGYTRIVKVGRRTGDAAPMSLIEFVGAEDEGKAKKQKSKAAKKATPKTKKEVPAETKKKQVPEADAAEQKVDKTQAAPEAEPEEEIEERTAPESKEEKGSEPAVEEENAQNAQGDTEEKEK